MKNHSLNPFTIQTGGRVLCIDHEDTHRRVTEPTTRFWIMRRPLLHPPSEEAFTVSFEDRRKPQRTKSCTRKRAFRHGSENCRPENKTDGVALAFGAGHCRTKTSSAEQHRRLSWAQSQGRGFIPNHHSQIQSSLGLCPSRRSLKGSSAKRFFYPGRGDCTDGPLEGWRGEHGERKPREPSTEELSAGNGQAWADRRINYTMGHSPSPAMIPRPNLFKLLSYSNPSCTEASLH